MKRLTKENWKKIIATVMLVLVIILAVFVKPQKAVSINTSKIKVVDDGSSQTKINTDVSISQKIINATDKELTVQVDFENYQYQKTQIALVLDNSFSMWSEDKLINSKDSIINLINNLFDNIDNVELSLTTYDGVKVAMGTNKEEIINQVNNITKYEGITTQTGLIEAQGTFTEEVNKYIILFTGGQEDISETISDIKNNNITLLTTFYGKSGSISRQYSKAGPVYILENVTSANLEAINTKIEKKIKSNMIKEIKDIAINNEFSREIAENFTFEIVTNPNAGTITLSDEGYSWEIDSLTKKSKATFKYKLTLKNDLDRNIMYKDIATNDNMQIMYKDTESEEESTLENNNTPLINIVETYTLKIKAINKKYTGLNAKGIEFKIEQINESDEVVRTEIVKTNEDGEIVIDDITENGTYKFRTTQISTSPAYELSDESKRVKTITVSKDYLSNTLTATTEDEDDIFTIAVNENDKTVTGTILMDPREFILNIRKIDEEYGNTIDEVDLCLEEPEGENIPKDITVNGRTKDGVAVLTAEVAGQGTYTYNLKETNVPAGYYENTEKMELKITFAEDGTPTEIKSSSKNIIIDEENAISGDTINLDVTNKMLDYTLKIQAFNEKYKSIKINDVDVQITGTDLSGNTVYTNEQVTKNGVIELPINKYGEIEYTIKQISAPAEYNLTEDVTYTLTRIFEDNDLILNSPTDDEDIILDNVNKILTVNIYLEQKTFNFKINKVDKDTKDLLDDAEIELTQPESRNKLKDVTVGGSIDLEADVVFSTDNGDGTYKSTYSIRETEKPIGYEKLNKNIGIDITFDSEGKVINAESSDTEYLQVIKKNEEVEVNLNNDRQTYSLQVVAKNKKYKNITIANVKINITGTGTDGEFLASTELITNEDGKTNTIEKLKQDGMLKFEIEEIAVPTEYLKNNQTAYASYSYTAETLSVPTNLDENVNVTVNNTSRLITIEVYLEPKTFDIEISKTCPVLENTLIAGAKFTLEQPDIKTTKREKVTGTTVLNEELIISGEVAGEGTFEYILKEVEAPNGYENIGVQIKLNITFDSEGNITNITNEETHNEESVNTVDESNDYITEEIAKNYSDVKTVRKDGDKDIIPISIENEQERPKLEINVYNKNYRTVSISNTEVKIIGETSTGEFYNKTLKTDEDGKINISGISNTGDFDFKAIAVKVPTGYIPQTEETIAYINKDAETTVLTKTVDVENVQLNKNKIIINLYLDVKTFDIEISKYEEELSDCAPRKGQII